MVAHSLMIYLHELVKYISNKVTYITVISYGLMVKRILTVYCISLNNFKAIVMSIYKNLSVTPNIN